MLSFQERIRKTKLNDQVNKMEIGQWSYKMQDKKLLNIKAEKIIFKKKMKSIIKAGKKSK